MNTHQTTSQKMKTKHNEWKVLQLFTAAIIAGIIRYALLNAPASVKAASISELTIEERLTKVREYLKHRSEQNTDPSNRETDIGPVKLVVIQPTPFCNLDCDYCYLPNRQLKTQLSLDLLEPIFKNLFQSNLIDQEFTIVWHAGEPLIMPIAFYEAAFQKINQLNQNLNKNRCQISHAFQTNGTLINPAWCDLIKRYQVQTGVSLDGPAFIHDAHRKTRKGMGTHASTMRGISLLKANNIDFHVIAVLTQDSLDFPEAIFNFFLEHEIRRVGFNIDEKEGGNLFSSFERVGVEEQYRAFIKRFYELVKNMNGYLQVRDFERIKKYIYYGFPNFIHQSVPFIIISIDYQGNFSTYIIGNVLNHSFASSGKTDKFKRMNQDIQSGIDLCRHTCQYFSVCGGGAPSNKYFENDSFASSETIYCRYKTKILTDIILEDIETSLNRITFT